MTHRTKLSIILIAFVLAGVIVMPSSWKTWALPYLPQQLHALVNKEISRGLDLAGGVGLDFKIDTSKLPEDRKATVLNGIVKVLSRRVDTLGVSEPNIVLSDVGNEKHVNVTIAGVSDVEEAKAVIGKIIQLEFKVMREGEATEEKAAIEQKAKDQTKDVTPETFQERSVTLASADPVNISSGTKDEFASDLYGPFGEELIKLKPGEMMKTPVEGTIAVTKNGQITSETGYIVAKLNDVKKELRTFPVQAEPMDAVAKALSDAKDWTTGLIKQDSLFAKRSYFTDASATLSVGQVSDVIETPDGYFVFKAKEKYDAGEKQVRASHILFMTEEATALQSVPEGATDEQKKQIEDANAKTRAAMDKNVKAEATAKDILERVKQDPASFATIAETMSEDPSAKQNKGDLGFFGKGQMVKEFEDAAFAANAGDILGPIKTQFGYHLLKVEEVKPENVSWANLEYVQVCYQGAGDICSTATRSKEEAKVRAEEAMKRLREETKYSFDYLLYSSVIDPWVPATVDNKQLTGEFFQRADVSFEQGRGVNPAVAISFTPEGGQLFEALTERYIGKQIGIFVGGVEVSSPVVQNKISGGQAVIQGTFTVAQASALARELNTGAIPAPITLVGEEVVGPELGADAMQKSLMAGLIGFIALSLFMIVYYRLSGLLAVIALVAYTIFFVAAIKILPGFNLTLASVAAIILSIGMAVDGNVLIFERFKEERKLSQKMSVAVEKSVERAWPAIRDSQFSSLITAYILFTFGTDIVKGFAVFLIIGILLSLFTSVWCTRILMHYAAKFGWYK